MTSLLQFRGDISERGVHLMAYRQAEDAKYWERGVELYNCTRCGRQHERLYTFIRKPAGMFGHWVVFRWHGQEHVPDLSIPIGIPGSPPRGARYMTETESSEAWHH